MAVARGTLGQTWKKKFKMPLRTVVVGILIILFFTRNLLVIFHTTLF